MLSERERECHLNSFYEEQSCICLREGTDRDGLVVRMSRSHPRGRSSIPHYGTTECVYILIDVSTFLGYNECYRLDSFKTLLLPAVRFQFSKSPSFLLLFKGLGAFENV